MDDEAIEELRNALTLIVRRLKAEKADDQLGATHSTVLMRLARKGPHTLGELSEFVHVSPPSMSQTVNSLVSSGLVERKPDPDDGRKVFISVTATGFTYANETSQRRHEWLAHQIEALSNADTQKLLKATPVLRAIADG